MNPLNHIAIIMDGNGRWAKERKHNRIWGHIRGAGVAKNIITECVKKNIKTLSLFAFSIENWQRPKGEVSFLMSLLSRNLLRELSLLLKNNVRFTCIGDLSNVPKTTLDTIKYISQKTEANTGLNLVFAVSYSGKRDLTLCMRKLAQQVADGKLQPQDINESIINNGLLTRDFEDPDLIIRTSGESRLSNFYLWQSAYSEIYLCKKNWPEFTVKDLDNAIDVYEKTERRFGKVKNSNHQNSHISVLQ